MPRSCLENAEANTDKTLAIRSEQLKVSVAHGVRIDLAEDERAADFLLWRDIR